MTTRSDYERLVLAKKYIEALEGEIEALKEEVQKQYQLRTKAEIERKIEVNRKEKMTPEEKLQIKSDLYVQQQKESVDSLRRKLKECNAKYEKSQGELIQVKMKLLNEE
jgi:polyhydroxyalkanoate synthesis regulator phasin